MTGPYESPDRPTAAEVDAAEAAVAAGYSMLDGMYRCPYGCPVAFHGPDTIAAIRHAEGHGGAR